MLSSSRRQSAIRMLQKLPPGERVEAGHRFVEDEQLGPFRDRQRERELGPLAAGELAGPLARIEAELADAALGQLVVPARVEPRAETEVIVNGKPRVGRGVLGHEANPAELPGVVRGRRPRTSIVPAVGAAARLPDAAAWSCRPRSGRRARRPVPCGIAQRAIRQRPRAGRTACRGRWPRERRSRYALCSGGPKGSHGRAPRCSRRPARPGAPCRATAAGPGEAVRARRAKRRSASW